MFGVGVLLLDIRIGYSSFYQRYQMTWLRNYSFNRDAISIPFWNLSSATAQLITFQIPSTYDVLLLRY